MGPLALTSSSLHSSLTDETADKHFWSVCFSPDGKLLATGVWDGVIRVGSKTFVLAIVIAVTIIFEANAQHGATFGSLLSRFGISLRGESSAGSGVTPRRYTRSFSHRTGDSSSLGRRMVQRGFGR